MCRWSPALLSEWDGATRGKVHQHQHQFFVHQKEEQQVNCCLGGGCVRGRWVLHIPGVQSMSPVPAVGHKEQNLADAAETVFQRSEGQERQLGSAF